MDFEFEFDPNPYNLYADKQPSGSEEEADFSLESMINNIVVDHLSIEGDVQATINDLLSAVEKIFNKLKRNTPAPKKKPTKIKKEKAKPK